jgi:hypothetical protein
VRLCLWTTDYCSSTSVEYGDPWWNDIDRGKRRTRRKTFASASLSTTNHMGWHECQSGPSLERLATDCVNHGTALTEVLMHIHMCIICEVICIWMAFFCDCALWSLVHTEELTVTSLILETVNSCEMSVTIYQTTLYLSPRVLQMLPHVFVQKYINWGLEAKFLSGFCSSAAPIAVV